MLNWISANFDGLLVGVIASAIFAIIALGVGKLHSYLKNRNSEYTGVWEQSIYESGDDTCQGAVIKKDRYKLVRSKQRYSGKLIVNIRGTIERMSPDEQQHRQWDYIGYLDSGILTILYQSKEGQKSRGCIYLKLIADLKFKGYYLEEHTDGTIDKVPLTLRKVQI